MIFLALIAAAVTVLPSDRMAMADRLFDRGDYASARVEYRALQNIDGVPADEILYRLAECDRLAGDLPKARAAYGELIQKFPLSRHADRSRLMSALSCEGQERVSALKLLDSDKVRPAVRASALYHLGTATGDKDALARCIKLEPKGPYALYAKFHHASLVADDPNPAVRRAAVGELLDVYYSGDSRLAREALYFAAVKCYGEKRYDESSILFRRYVKGASKDDARLTAARNYAAWSDYLLGRYTDAAAMCEGTGSDDAAYLLAVCAYANADYTKARELMAKYLEDFPQGRFRSAVELPLSRMDFDSAEKTNAPAKMIEAAQRSVAISKKPHDRLRLAWAYEKNERLAEARAGYSSLAKDFPGSSEAVEALFRKAMIDIREQKWSAAELALAELLSSPKCESRRAESLYWRGISAVRLGHEQSGAQFLREALKSGLSLDQSREARLVLADEDYKAGRAAQAKAEYARLVREGATERMGAAKLSAVGRFLLDSSDGEKPLEEVKSCAKALLKVSDKSPQWRQEAFSLLGEAEEAGGEYSSAIGSYRQALAEKVCTERRRSAALRFGILLYRAGELEEAETALKEAVKLNNTDSSSRASAYLHLAKTRLANSDVQGACDYATVVVTLFDDPQTVAAAKKILSAHSKEDK